MQPSTHLVLQHAVLHQLRQQPQRRCRHALINVAHELSEARGEARRKFVQARHVLAAQEKATQVEEVFSSSKAGVTAGQPCLGAAWQMCRICNHCVGYLGGALRQQQH